MIAGLASGGGHGDGAPTLLRRRTLAWSERPRIAAGRPLRSPGPSLFTRDFVLLVFGQLFQSLGYASLPLLPLYLAHLGASRVEIGGVMAAGAIGGLTLRPLVGWALDAIGRRPVLIAGTVLLAIGTGLVAAVDDVGVAMHAVRVVFGIGVGALFTGYFAFAADIIPESRRTEGIALFGIAGLLPLTVNPVVTLLGVEGGELRGFFAITGVVILASIVFVVMVGEPARERPPRGAPTGLRVVLRGLLVPGMWPVWMATTVFSGMVAVFFAFATVAGADRGIELATLVWLTYAGGAISVRLLGARLPDRVGVHNMVVPSLGLYVSALVVVADGDTTNAFLLAGLLAGLGHGYGFPVITSLVITRSPASARGAALSGFTGLWDVSILTLSPLAGLLADAYGDCVMFTLTAIVVVAALAVWATFEHRWGTSRATT